MNLNCGIAEDLLPLYLEDGCSQDSRAALEEAALELLHYNDVFHQRIVE